MPIMLVEESWQGEIVKVVEVADNEFAAGAGQV